MHFYKNVTTLILVYIVWGKEIPLSGSFNYHSERAYVVVYLAQTVRVSKYVTTIRYA